MDIYNIDALLDKYFEGDTSIAEEKTLKAYFNSNQIEEKHQQFSSLFVYLSEAKKINLQKDIEPSLSNIDQLLDKYFEGETSIAEEKTLKAYFNSENIAEEHKAFSNLFQYFIDAKEVKLDKEIDLEQNNIDILLDNYFNGETSIEDERTLKAYFNSNSIAKEHEQFKNLFEYFSIAQTEQLEHKIELDLNKKAKVSYLKVVRSRMISIAASLIIILGSIFIIKNAIDQNTANQIALNLTAQEELEAEEALETTMEALAYLGVKFNKGKESMENIKQLDKAKIFKQ